MSTDPPDRPAGSDPVVPRGTTMVDRYAPIVTPERRRRRIAAVSVLAVAAAAWLLWTAVHNASSDLAWREVSFDVSAPDTTTVTFETTMDPGARASCQVQALDARYTEVGSTTVEVGPQDARVLLTTVTLRTGSQAVTGVVRDCSLLD